MKVMVHVTAQDIANGKRHCPTQCPLANAINLALGIGNISISPDNGASGLWHAYVGQYKPRQKSELPPAAVAFAVLFDRTGIAEPISFEMDVPA